jgi:hypothetical protein
MLLQVNIFRADILSGKILSLFAFNNKALKNGQIIGKEP